MPLTYEQCSENFTDRRVEVLTRLIRILTLSLQLAISRLENWHPESKNSSIYMSFIKVPGVLCDVVALLIIEETLMRNAVLCSRSLKCSS
jgi:hypothetical protein